MKTKTEDGKKCCTTCGKRKLFEKFFPHKGGMFGVGPKCRQCISIYDKARRKAEKDAWHSDGETLRACARCKLEKPILEFEKLHSRVFGDHFARYCISCKSNAIKADTERRARHRKLEDSRKIQRLDDRYVRVKIAQQMGLKYSEIPLELVNMKRVQLETKRMSRKLRSALNESSKNSC